MKITYWIDYETIGIGIWLDIEKDRCGYYKTEYHITFSFLCWNFGIHF